MIAPNANGVVDFMLHVGEKEPKPNMNGQGNIGLPIIFSGKGTGKGESNWIVLPGSKIDQVDPSGKGTQMSGGSLRIIRFLVTKGDGEKNGADVILRRK